MQSVQQHQLRAQRSRPGRPSRKRRPTPIPRRSPRSGRTRSRSARKRSVSPTWSKAWRITAQDLPAQASASRCKTASGLCSLPGQSPPRPRTPLLRLRISRSPPLRHSMPPPRLPRPTGQRKAAERTRRTVPRLGSRLRVSHRPRPRPRLPRSRPPPASRNPVRPRRANQPRLANLRASRLPRSRPRLPRSRSPPASRNPVRPRRANQPRLANLRASRLPRPRPRLPRSRPPPAGRNPVRPRRANPRASQPRPASPSRRPPQVSRLPQAKRQLPRNRVLRRTPRRPSKPPQAARHPPARHRRRGRPRLVAASSAYSPSLLGPELIPLTPAAISAVGCGEGGDAVDGVGSGYV